MVGHPPHGKGPGGGLGPGGLVSDAAAPEAENIQEVGVHLGGDGWRGGGFPYDGGVHLEKVEHGRAVHFYVIDYGPV